MGRNFRIAASVAIFLGLAGCVAAPPSSIVVATMDAEGTIRLQLMAKGDGAVGDAVLVYSPTDPQYEEIKKHVGGLKPGEEKPVPPWPDLGH